MRMERFLVSKCLPVPESGMNIELFVVNNSDVALSSTKMTKFGGKQGARDKEQLQHLGL